MEKQMNETSQDILIQHIENYRMSHGLNYMKLAIELHIPYSTLIAVLQKKHIPRIDTIDLLAQAMGMETYELICRQPFRKGQETLGKMDIEDGEELEGGQTCGDQ